MVKPLQLKNMLRHCVQAQYRINPIPSTLTSSLPIYTYFASLGNIIQYRQDQCPVTKKRLENIKMIYYDPDIVPDSIKNGHIVQYGDVAFQEKDREALTTLEQTLLEKNSIEIPESDKKYSLTLDFLTRNEDSITRARDTAFADQFAVPKQGTVAERVAQAEQKQNEQLKGFNGTFGIEQTND